MKRTTLSFIICNEFCERFCFYGLRSLLFAFTRSEYGFSAKQATLTLHSFISMSYLFTLVGGFLSDVLLGRYRTIVSLSAVYFTGTTLLTYSAVVSRSPMLVVGSLLMIAVGTGGIKPCVAAFGGDQFGPGDTQRMNRFFSLFYFAINIGSMLSMVSAPVMASLGCLGRDSCYPLAFGTASVLLGGSIVLFVLGSGSYVIKPVRKDGLSVVLKSLARHGPEDDNALSASEIVHRLNVRDSAERLMRVVRLFGPVAFFWMLYDQQSSSWVEQGLKMNTRLVLFSRSFEILSSQMQAFNSVFVLLFIPLFSKIIYPAIESANLVFSPISKMACGLVLAALSFFCAACVEHRVASLAAVHEQLSILWQLPQYILLTAGEIMLNMTGLEYAYAEAPEMLKSVILSVWLLTVAAGNLFVMLFSLLDITMLFPPHSREMWNFVFYGVVGLCAARHLFSLNVR